MGSHQFLRKTLLPVSAEAAYAWHARPGAFERLLPPWENASVLHRSGGIDDCGTLEVALRIGPLKKSWLAEHLPSTPGREFRDVQARGPFAQFDHTHRFVPNPPDGCYLEDEIAYRLPAGAAGELLGRGLARRRLARMFDYRHRVTAADLAAHALYEEKPRMNILISGANGLIGTALQAFLTTGGHQVRRLTRGKKNKDADEACWDPAAGEMDADALDGIDAVVHLAGESIAEGRWTAAKKARIRDSRVQPTRLLCERMAAMSSPPRVLVCASAIGFYGDRGDELLTEESRAGDGFLPDVCVAWEAAAAPALNAGIRVAHTRFGIVLSPRGGALQKMLLPVKLGVGGPMGNGRQYWSWVSIDDCVGAIHHAVQNENVFGPVNVVAPNAPTNRDFTRTLGKVLHRPTIAPLPGFVARLMLGEMADALLLASTRVAPHKLQQTGYQFRDPELESALRHLLGR